MELELQTQQEELRQLNSTKDKFFSIIAHDLKNPFSTLLNVTNFFRDSYHEMPPEDIELNIQSMHSAAHRTYKLLENLLEWARNSMGGISYEPSSHDIIEIVNVCAGHLKSQAAVKNITLQTPEEYNKIYANCDTNLILTVIRNLVSNAIKFSFNDSTIKIDVTDFDDKYIKVAIQDAGTGISEEIIAKLFKIDEKITSKGTSGESGTGLGLILCKEFIDKHSGKIWVESEIGKGTTFFFTLPKSV
jgi:signal transduction histidine kinase